MSPSPRNEYYARRSAHAAIYQRMARLDARLSNARLTMFAVILLFLWLAFWRQALTGWWVLPPVACFVALVIRHGRVVLARDASKRAIDFYDRGIARIEDRWAGGGESGVRFLDEEHLYASDLDLFGCGSLFELLCIARTRAGEDMLAGWLKAPAPIEALRLRQRSIEELRGRLDFREQLAVAGTAVRTIDTAALTVWATAPPVLNFMWPRIVAPLLAAGAIGSGIWWGVGGPLAPLLTIILAEIVFARAFLKRVSKVLHGIDRPAGGLDVLAQALIRIEREPVSAARLSDLRAALTINGVSASQAIMRLQRIAERHEWKRNAIFAPIAAAMLWSTQISFAIEAWRRKFGSHVPDWFRTLGEYEALSSLAAYAYEHPSDPFPTFVEGQPGMFAGVALGHPLVPAAQMVPNDVLLAGDLRLLVVSGSNMSGKSTLLRTVGINAVLALAGAPVRAQKLDLTPVHLGATLRIQDSLHAGRSRFFAEISRVRDIVDLANGSSPVLFLFDELFQGTNSHDRAIGAAAVLKTLVQRDAIGLVTTHDLALTAIADEIDGRAANVHFEDRIDRGELAFDYRMRPGPVTRGNGLALMRAVGLQVSDENSVAGLRRSGV